jgi:hypothetical protein
LASFLRRCWSSQTSYEIPSISELNEVTPLLYESGAAALGWWRIRDSDFAQTESGELLHQAFRLLVLHARMQERQIRKTFHCLRAANIEPILIKGWAVARLYPLIGLRPSGDIDLIIRPADYVIAREVAAHNAPEVQIDFHVLPFELKDRSLDLLFDRSRLVLCGDDSVRVLSNEDHFALLAIHFLKHGGWRPLWLCDLGVMLESMPRDFDWDMCLGNDKRRANWILAAIGLAHEILDASIADEVIAARASGLPPWLVDCVLKQWETPFANAQAPQRHHAPIASYLRRPGGLLGDLARRWPNPIMATVSVNGVFSVRPRRRYQFLNWLLRAYRILLNQARWARPFSERHHVFHK